MKPHFFSSISSLLLVVLGVAFISSVAQAKPDDQIRLKVQIREGVSAVMRLRVVELHRRKPKFGVNKNIVLVPGLSHTGVSYENFVEALDGSPESARVHKAVLFDYPGKGDNSLPISKNEPVLFGDLSLDDDARALIGSLKKLRRLGRAPEVIIAHSMGGMVVFRAQELLIQENKSLANFGVRTVVAHAPSIPGELPWYLADSGTFAQVAGSFVTVDPTRGVILQIPPPALLALFFRDLAGNFVPNTPSIEDASRYATPESFVAASQLGGVGTPRLSVRAGAFAPARGVRLVVAALSQDPYSIFPGELQALYSHLSGDASLRDFYAVVNPLAVHDAYVSNPELLLGVLAQSRALR
jgi:pimeloyl-ACP methyl ester carboxylesterase